MNGWYADAAKAFWTPPNVVFGPVWTVLYTLMSVAAWLVWRERDRRNVRSALTVYVVQLVLNAIWTPLFFGLYPVLGVAALWIALVVIVAIDVMVLVTMLRFWPVRRWAALLLIPTGPGCSTRPLSTSTSPPRINLTRHRKRECRGIRCA